MEYSSMTNEQLEQLIEQKDMDAACEMAERCLEGTHGVEQNLNRAYQLYHRGESQGNRRAYSGLGHMYEHGILFAQNIELAKKYYEKAGVQRTVFAEEKPSTRPVALDMSASFTPMSEATSADAGKTTAADDTDQMVAAYNAMQTTVAQSMGQPVMAATQEIGAGQPMVSAANPVVNQSIQQPVAVPVYTQGQQNNMSMSMPSYDMSTLVIEKAMEAAAAAKEAAVKAQEAAMAAEMAADYAKKMI